MGRVVVAACVLSLVVPVAKVDAQENPLYPPDAKVEGKTLAEWAGAFMQWAWSIKKSQSPIADKTGERAGDGQKGVVFFLAGNLGDITERTVTVPADKVIFSPLIYTFTTDKIRPLDAGVASDHKRNVNRYRDLSATLNGKDLGKLDGHRAAVPPVKVAFPESADDSVFPPYAGARMASGEGYWLMLKPLPPGEHVFHVKGRVPPQDDKRAFVLDLKYTLKVQKGK